MRSTRPGSATRIASTSISRSGRRSRTKASRHAPSPIMPRRNRLRRESLRYDAESVTAHVRRCQELFTPSFFAARRDQGCAAPDPIFILGMPRAGSTLIEQILASHPEVEGTMELPDIPAIARRLGGRKLRSDESAYPDCLADLDADALARAGRGISRAHPDPAQDRPALLRRQDAQQLDERRPDPAHPAASPDHRRSPPPARLLLFQLQAAFRPRPGLFLRPRRAGRLLSRLCAR